MDTFFSIVSFLVSSSDETFVKQNRWFRGGGDRRISRKSNPSLIVPKYGGILVTPNRFNGLITAEIDEKSSQFLILTTFNNLLCCLVC